MGSDEESGGGGRLKERRRACPAHVVFVGPQQQLTSTTGPSPVTLVEHSSDGASPSNSGERPGRSYR